MPAFKMQTDIVIFISYSRADTEFARDLYDKLAALGFKLWRDRSEMEAGENWWQQIQEAIRQADTMVLVLSPKALASPVVAKEWLYARQVGTRVIPVVAEDVDFNAVPRWMTRIDWLDFRKNASEHDLIWTKFIQQLSSPYQRVRIPYTMPELPEHFVERPNELDALLKLLLDTNRGNPVAITTALQGGSGFGKTTLAKALCYHEDVLHAFSDGILWVTFDVQPNVLGLLLDQIAYLSDKRPDFADVNLASKRLDELLADRELLMVLDDVWNEASVRPFLTVGKRCAHLLTTRRQDIASNVKAQTVTVNEMQPSEASQLLIKWLEKPPDDLHPLEDLAGMLGEWPLLLALVGAYLREAVKVDKQSLDDALVSVRKRLERRGFTAFDRTDEGQRNQAISISLEVSLDRLGKWRERYFELAIFPPDNEVPFKTVEQLWRARAKLDDIDTEDALKAMQRLSLFTDYDASQKTLRLHDAIRTYLGSQLPDVPALHATLIDAWGDPYQLSDEYAWHWYVYHLKGAGRIEAIRQLLFDFNWLQTKLDATDVNSLLPDFDLLPEDAELQLVKDAIRLSAYVLSADKAQLASQLLGRLLSYDTPDTPGIQRLLLGARQYKRTIWFHPLTANLNQAGGPLVRLFYGHNISVQALAVSHNKKQLISASSDKTLKLWDLETGYLIHTFQDHTHAVWAVAVTADGKRAVSASDDTTVKVWNLEDRSLVYTFSEHKQWVHAVAMDADGKIAVSGSEAGELLVWRLSDGKVLHTLEGHSKSALTYINGVAVTADGKRAVSASRDSTLKVWDLERGECLYTLEGHEDSVLAVAVTADGKRAVSASRDSTLKVWDLERGIQLHTLRDHTSTVRGVAMMPDERAVSGSSDTTLKVWDIEHGKLLQTIAADNGPITAAVAVYDEGRKVISGSETNPTFQEWDLKRAARKPTPSGQKHPILALAVTTAGLVISASQDKALKVWNLHEGKELYTLRPIHEKTWVYALAEVSDKHIVSASWDKILKVWDVQSGQILYALKGHRSAVKAVAVTADRRWIVSGSRDATLKVWNVENGQEEFTLPGHKASIDAVAVTMDGRAVSGSSDTTLIVWDLEKRQILRILDGHEAAVTAVAVTTDGRAVSASCEANLIVWNLENGQQLQILKGHNDMVHAVEVTPDGKYAVSAADDNTLKLWNLDNGHCLATFTGEGAFSACRIAQDGITVLAGEKSGRIHFFRLENL